MTNFSVSELHHAYKCLLDVIVGTSCKIIARGLWAEEEGDYKEH